MRIMKPVAYERIKTEHAGAKNGGGVWMTHAEAKQTAKRLRRREDKTHGELPSYFDKEASSTEKHEDCWAAESAREALREERW